MTTHDSQRACLVVSVGRTRRKHDPRVQGVINRGNLVDIAVAFVLGVAFAGVVTTFTDRIVNPLIAMIIPGIDDLAALGTFGENGSVGAFLGALINFIIVAFVLFLVVRAYNRMKAEQEAAGPSEEVALLTEIRDALRSR